MASTSSRTETTRTGLLAPDAPTLVYAGVAIVAFGFALLAYTWGRVAGTLSIALQLPYIASGGFTGLALIVLGALLVSVAVGRRDARARADQLDELAEVVRRMARLAGAPDDDEADGDGTPGPS